MTSRKKSTSGSLEVAQSTPDPEAVSATPVARVSLVPKAETGLTSVLSSASPAVPMMDPHMELSATLVADHLAQTSAPTVVLVEQDLPEPVVNPERQQLKCQAQQVRHEAVAATEDDHAGYTRPSSPEPVGPSDFPQDLLSPDMSDLASHISEEEDLRRDRENGEGMPVEFTPLPAATSVEVTLDAQLDVVARQAEKLHITPQADQPEGKAVGTTEAREKDEGPSPDPAAPVSGQK